MLEVQDELMTPGCPQCAIKHLSAALYHSATFGRVPTREDVCESMVCAARAYINLGEVLVGYRSHLWFAVGLLQRAEERALTEVSDASGARHARLTLEERGMGAVRETMRNLSIDYWFDPATMAIAHIDEAMRELPAFGWAGAFADIPATIERIREDYFSLPEDTVSEGVNLPEATAGGTANKEGVPDMATTKKAAPVVKKATGKTKVPPAAKTAKATKACSKGGRCKK